MQGQGKRWKGKVRNYRVQSEFEGNGERCRAQGMIKNIEA